MASTTPDHGSGPHRLTDDFTDPDTEALGNEIAELASYLAAAEARFLELIARFEADGCAARLGFASTARWLNYRCGIGMNAAREKVRVANALVGLPSAQIVYE